MSIPYEKQRVNITLSKDVLKWIDETVDQMKLFNKTINRSRLIELLILGFIEAQGSTKQQDIKAENLLNKKGK